MAQILFLPLTHNVLDSGPNNYTASYSNPSFLYDSSTLKAAYNSSSQISIPCKALRGKTTWSFCFFIYPISSLITANQTDVFRLEDGGSALRVQVYPTSSASASLSVYNNSTNYLFTGNITGGITTNHYNKYIHYILTCDGTTVKRYIDGQLNGSTSLNGSNKSALTGEIKICNSNKAPISDVRVFDHCLTADEIAEYSQPRYVKKINWPNSSDQLIVNYDGMGNDQILFSSDENKTSFARSINFSLAPVENGSSLGKSLTINQNAAEYLMLNYGSLNYGKLKG